MSRITDWLRKKRFHQILSAFVLGLVILCSPLASSLSAQAVTLTPEARAYEVDQNNLEQAQNKAEDAGSGLLGSLKSTADNVREKLNLDEPIPETTKTTLKQIQGEDVTPQEPRPSGKSGGEI